MVNIMDKSNVLESRLDKITDDLGDLIYKHDLFIGIHQHNTKFLIVENPSLSKIDSTLNIIDQQISHLYYLHGCMVGLYFKKQETSNAN